MSLVQHIKSELNGKGSPSKDGAALRRKAFDRLADRWGIDDDKREEAEKELRLYLEVLRDDD